MLIIYKGVYQVDKMAEVATIAQKQWALDTIKNAVRKEAFLNTLKQNLNNLTTDVEVGTRFISTLDYDGNLYECKQSDYTDLMTLPLYERDFRNDRIKVWKEARRTEPSKQDIGFLFPGGKDKDGQIWFPVSWHEEMWEQLKGLKGKTIEIPGQYESEDTRHAFERLTGKKYKMRDDENAPHIDFCHSVDDKMPFTITNLRVIYRFHKMSEDEPFQEYNAYEAVGYYPLLERQVKRIWVRKCNLVAEALGKNIDSSRKCINFTLEKMNVRDVLDAEVEKLKKARKIFDAGHPERARSVSWKEIEEQEAQIRESLRNIECVYYDLYGRNIEVDAFYCRKYGYLIPLKAEIRVNLAGKNVEGMLREENDKLRDKIDAEMEKKNALVNEIIPGALHPDRVGRLIEKYDSIDKVVGGDEKVIVEDYKSGKRGVVVESVFG